MRGLRLGLVALALALPGIVAAQSSAQSSAQQAADRELREQRDELERVRREREALERDAAVLRTTAHELSDEVQNLDRRVEATARLVRTIDRNLASIAGQVTAASANMARAETELAAKKRTLETRVVDVYKRGPLFTVEAMLSAHSFGELVARYKYLHDLTLRDRALVDRVQELRNRVALERDRLVQLQMQLEASRADRQRETERLIELEQEQASNLRVVQQQAKRTEDKIARLRRTETEMLNVLAAMEAARKKAEASRSAATRAAAATSAIKTSDYGRLDWPVDGTLVYTFGKAHWKGIGISAPSGTPVHSVAAGKVMMVRPLGTYGLTVFLDHGGGDYTIYGSLKSASVKEGETVAKGDVLGQTGVSDPDLPAHLHFEIRTGGRDAVDPVKWLRTRR
jgi:septal ring factor EnvC (AmiA/AmiB activator)